MGGTVHESVIRHLRHVLTHPERPPRGAVADASVCPILTADAPKWRDPAAALDDPLHIIEIAEPPKG